MTEGQIAIGILGMLITVSIWAANRMKTGDDQRLIALEKRVDDITNRMDKQSSELREDFAKLEAKLDRIMDMIINDKRGK